MHFNYMGNTATGNYPFTDEMRKHWFQDVLVYLKYSIFTAPQYFNFYGSIWQNRYIPMLSNYQNVMEDIKITLVLRIHKQVHVDNFSKVYLEFY